MIHRIIQPKKITIQILIHLEMICLKTHPEIRHLIQFPFDLIHPIQNHFQNHKQISLALGEKID